MRVYKPASCINLGLLPISWTSDHLEMLLNTFRSNICLRIANWICNQNHTIIIFSIVFYRADIMADFSNQATKLTNFIIKSNMNILTTLMFAPWARFVRSTAFFSRSLQLQTWTTIQRILANLWSHIIFTLLWETGFICRPPDSQLTRFEQPPTHRHLPFPPPVPKSELSLYIHYTHDLHLLFMPSGLLVLTRTTTRSLSLTSVA